MIWCNMISCYLKIVFVNRVVYVYMIREWEESDWHMLQVSHNSAHLNEIGDKKKGENTKGHWEIQLCKACEDPWPKKSSK